MVCSASAYAWSGVAHGHWSITSSPSGSWPHEPPEPDALTRQWRALPEPRGSGPRVTAARSEMCRAGREATPRRASPGAMLKLSCRSHSARGRSCAMSRRQAPARGFDGVAPDVSTWATRPNSPADPCTAGTSRRAHKGRGSFREGPVEQKRQRVQRWTNLTVDTHGLGQGNHESRHSTRRNRTRWRLRPRSLQ